MANADARSRNRRRARVEAPDNTVKAARAPRRLRPATPARPEPTRRDAPETPTLNAIRPGRRIQRAPEASRSRSDSTAAPRTVPESERVDAGPRESAVPEQVAERFVRVGNRFYFPNGEQAFKDRGGRLTTPSENTEVIRSMLEIAQARGWQKITVSGTERFRREAWMQGRMAGLSVRGYRATEIEQAQLVRQIDRQRSKTAGAPEAAPEPAEPREAEAPKAPVSQERLYQGRLKDFGAAPYQFDRREPMSYYVKLETRDGETVLWGRDLERAVGSSLSQVKVGDEVAVRQVGERPVTIQRPKRDEQGRVTGQESVAAYRNRWLVEKQEFLSARAGLARIVRDPSADPKALAKERPELAGTFLELKAAELVAKEAYPDRRDQLRFVARVREALAAEIERGEALSAVRLREPERQIDRGLRLRTPERVAVRVMS